jgi:hypothetical protein
VYCKLQVGAPKCGHRLAASRIPTDPTLIRVSPFTS